METVRRGRARLAVLVALIMLASTTLVVGSSPAAQAATQTEIIGESLDRIAVSPDGSRVYATAWTVRSLAIIDTDSETVARRVPLPRSPWGVASGTTVHGERVYVATRGEGWQEPGVLEVVDPVAGTVVGSVRVGGFPRAVAVSPDGARVYVGNHEDGTVTVVDAATSTVLDTVTVGIQPAEIQVSPDGLRVYVAHVGPRGAPSVTFVDAEELEVVAQVVLPGDERDDDASTNGAALSPDGSLLYVTEARNELLHVIDTATAELVRSAPTGRYPYGVAVSPDGGTVYVANEQQASLSVYDAKTLESRLLPVPTYPVDVAVSPDGARLYVSDLIFGYVTVIAAPVIREISPPYGPLEGGWTIVISGERFTGTTSVRFGDNPAGFTVDSDRELGVVVPAGVSPGPVDVVVTTADGSSQPMTFTYLADPTITGLASPGGELGAAIDDAVRITGSGVPTGTVDFALHGPDDPSCTGTPLFTATDVAVVGGLARSPRFTPQHAGLYQWIASYSGDALHLPATAACGTSGQSSSIAPATTSVSVSSTSNPAQPGADVTLSAAVTGGTAPTGSVLFTVDGAPAAEAELVDGLASFTTASLAPGDHVVTAVYSGDADHRPSSGSTTQSISKITTRLDVDPVLRSLPNLTAHLTAADGSPVPGEQVTFRGQVLFSQVTLCTATTDATGTARCSGGWLVGLLTLGWYAAEFAGDDQYLPSSGRGSLL